MKYDQLKFRTLEIQIPEKNTRVETEHNKHTGEYLDERTKTGSSSPWKQTWLDKNDNSETKAKQN